MHHFYLYAGKFSFVIAKQKVSNKNDLFMNV